MKPMDGFVAPGFERVREAFAASLEEELGASFAALRDGEIVVNLWGGFADREETKAWARDTLVPVFSTTKGVAAIVMALLADRGLIDYETPVARYWEAFGAHGKDRVSVAQTLAHQAGVPGFATPIDPDLWLDPPRCAAAIAALEPMWAPGSASGYHPLTWGYIVGELAQRVAGRSLGQILREDITAPFGIDFHIGLPDSEHHRCAAMRKPVRAGDFGTITAPRRAAFFQPWSAPVRGSALWRRIEIPSANGHGTALAVAQLYDFYASAGRIGGQPIVSSIEALTARRWIGDDLVLPFRLDWRSGVLGNSNRLYGPNPDAFGHSGHGGSLGMGDPAASLAAGYVMNKQSPHVMGDPRGSRLIEALYACV